MYLFIIKKKIKIGIYNILSRLKYIDYIINVSY